MITIPAKNDMFLILHKDCGLQKKKTYFSFFNCTAIVTAVPTKNELFLVIHMDCDDDDNSFKKNDTFLILNRITTMIAVPVKK